MQWISFTAVIFITSITPIKNDGLYLSMEYFIQMNFTDWFVLKYISSYLMGSGSETKEDIITEWQEAKYYDECFIMQNVHRYGEEKLKLRLKNKFFIT